ncbi:oxidation resistance protein 1 isoform X7 [Sitodiplosis mosellana]|uniref:oxidation resistance protein 1 isoform X7 n=1 Tax=Sitodiplosis mosellana TaxID=263140 RepID=UPI002444A57F|nr:oxidation resistance protein 1 isoform X7 [Sitodiplosis mosellana]XP_055302097.1 oxidation resistance protein 1 isoform X7 [Sitodiplosis mosellana]XP_055302098.1 oxidation resistance protein 1 isoform X7 [Sitodiplosis mosellana]
MTSVFFQGKYRQRKDWSTNSIPELMSLEEEASHALPEIPTTLPPKAPRRSSLAIGLLAGGRGLTDPKSKRRSSIATAFLGRQNKNKDASYETAVASEKRDSRDQNNQNENDSNGTPKFCDFADDDLNGNGSDENEQTQSSPFSTSPPIVVGSPRQSLFTSTPDKDKRRRSSTWHTKIERRRRKNSSNPSSISSSVIDDSDIDDLNGNSISEVMADSPPTEYSRQKRHSWWNIFVPDNIKQRSRRNSSQDIEVLSRSSDNLAPRPFRSKSRSVDHGLAAPFANLDSLRSTVEGRFDSVERLSKEKLKGSLPSIPTTTYMVGNRDTLTSVAARFDTTPGELTSLNKLNSSFIYPGQSLLVPDKTGSSSENISDLGSDVAIQGSPIEKTRKLSTEEVQQEEKERELLDGLRPGSPKPGHIKRIESPAIKNQNEDDPIVTQRFLKINVRHITDGQGVVGGVLLVTPNAVMFDPNVSDPLVIEHGPESYGVIAPMELVVNAAIFHDIAHMRVAGGESSSSEKVEIYYPKPPCISSDASHSPGKDSLLVKDETFPELGVGSVEGCDDQESVCSSNEREGDAFPKAFDRELVTPTNLQKSQAESVDNKANDNETKESNALKTVNSTATTNEDNDSNSVLGKEFKEMRTLEERRRSLLDHHWAIPSKDSRSLEDDSIAEVTEPIPSIPANIPENAELIEKVAASIASISIENSEQDPQLMKQSCHDSGIDIRDPNLPVVLNTKKNYSDADIVLSSDWVPPITIAPTDYTDTQSRSQDTRLNAGGTSLTEPTVVGRKKTSSVSFSVDDNSDSQQHHSTSSDKTSDNNKKNKMLKRLSYPLTGLIEGLAGTGDDKLRSDSAESAPNTGDSNQSVFSKVFSRRSSIGTFIRPNSSDGSQTKSVKAPPPKLDYRSMVSIDDCQSLFVSFDKLIPRPARACADPPLYLRLRMGRPLGKTMPLPSNVVMSYGKNKLRPEFWFSIPKNRIDELYRFLNTWVPHLYGELDEQEVAKRGYELIQNDTDWVKSGQNKDGQMTSDGEDISELTRESWEVLSMSTDDYRKASLFATGSFDQDFPLPDLIGNTEILTEEHREKLCGHLPARAEGYSWSLVFSTSQNGFSLNSLYRKLARIESPILIVIQDTENNVFGALTSCSLHVSELFYGTGESLLFKFNPSFKVFHWTGENLYFIKGNPESLSIGAGDGKFGLWLDGDLNQGRSQRCSTYANEPLAPQEDFVVKTLECWAFV